MPDTTPAHVRRHETVAANARRTPMASADVMQTVALLGETVEDLKARLPIMRGLQVPVPVEWLNRIEGKLDELLRRTAPVPKHVEGDPVPPHIKAQILARVDAWNAPK